MLIKRLILLPTKLLGSHFFAIAMIGIIVFGWLQRGDNYLSAESGAGYFLGILGGSLMLILLLYPLSKRITLFTRWIPIRFWFGIHMLFGILGPVMILFHSNFQLGSTNSSIALFSMLLVAGSGLFGRYFYTRIHRGLYGARLTLKELKQDTESNHQSLLKMYDMDEKLNAQLNKQLNKMEEKVLQSYTGLTKGMMHIIYLALSAKKLNLNVRRVLKESFEGNEPSNDMAMDMMLDNKLVIQSINRYTGALRQAAAFKVYERLFSLWHILHLPIFFMMIVTAVIHIFAVHMY